MGRFVHFDPFQIGTQSTQFGRSLSSGGIRSNFGRRNFGGASGPILVLGGVTVAVTSAGTVAATLLASVAPAPVGPVEPAEAATRAAPVGPVLMLSPFLRARSTFRLRRCHCVSVRQLTHIVGNGRSCCLLSRLRRK